MAVVGRVVVDPPAEAAVAGQEVVDPLVVTVGQAADPPVAAGLVVVVDPRRQRLARWQWTVWWQ